MVVVVHVLLIPLQVLQKLNCKTNAAGWVPSSSNRTAQAFSQPGKGVPHIVGGTVRLASSQLPGTPASANKQNKSSQVYVSNNVQSIELKSCKAITSLSSSQKLATLLAIIPSLSKRVG